MKKFKCICIFMLSVCFCTLINAQTEYKKVTIDRDINSVYCVRIKNANAYPVKINFQYQIKINGQTSGWIDFSSDSDPVFFGPHCNEIIRLGDLDTRIVGLKLTYVDILYPSASEVIDTLVSGWIRGKQKR